MIAPAQNQPTPDSTTLVIREKYQELLDHGPFRVTLTYNYQPTQLANTLTQQLRSSLASDQPTDATQYMPLFLGKLESTLASTDPILILSREFGPDIEKLELQQAINQVCKVVHYSVDKFKGMQLRQVSDRKAFDGMAAFYDVKAMKKHRKMCQYVKSYTKTRKTFMESVESGGDIFPQHCQAHQEYLKLMTEQLEISKLSLPEEPVNQEEEDHLTPMKAVPKKKDDTASTHKNKQEHQVQNGEQVMIDEAIAPSQILNPTKRIKRTKEEVEREREERQKERETKQKEKEAKQREREEKQREREEKQKEKERKKLQEEARRKEKEKEKMQKEAEKKEREEQKAKEKQAKEKEKEAQKLAKEAEKLAKEKKKQSGQSLMLMNWLNKPEGSASRQERQESSNDMRCEKQQAQDELMALLKRQSTPIEQCRSQLSSGKMREERRIFESYFANIVMRRSRLQFTNFLVTDERCTNYSRPYDEAEEGRYEESSIEYQDICGQFCNQNEADAMSEEEEEEASANSAIVPDSYKSEDEISSEEEGGEVRVNIDRGSEWAFCVDCHPRAIEFAMICLQEGLPLPVSDPEPPSQLNNTLKCQLYMEIHGYFGVKEPLMRKLAAIAERVSKSALDGLLKETTTKRGNQRLVRPQIIEYLNQVQEGFADDLQAVRVRREAQWHEQMRDKVSQKERHLQALILEGGTYNIMEIMQMLKEKGHRMLKKDLLQFIDNRTGQVWEEVRQRIKRRAPKQTATMNQFLRPAATSTSNPPNKTNPDSANQPDQPSVQAE